MGDGDQGCTGFRIVLYLLPCLLLLYAFFCTTLYVDIQTQIFCYLLQQIFYIKDGVEKLHFTKFLSNRLYTLNKHFLCLVIDN